MTKYLVSLLLLLSSILVQSQIITKKDLNKSYWFTDNKDSVFFKSDTIKIIKYSNQSPEWSKTDYAECEQEYLGHGKYIELGFGKFKALNYTEIYYSSSMIDLASKYNWDFKNDLILRILKNNKPICSLKPISLKEVEIKSRFAEQKDLLKTQELTFVRIK